MHNIEIQTLTELLTNQQNQILSLSLHLDCLIEELVETDLLDSDRFDKRMKRKLKKLQNVANKLRENEEQLPPMHNYSGTIGEA